MYNYEPTMRAARPVGTTMYLGAEPQQHTTLPRYHRDLEMAKEPHKATPAAAPVKVKRRGDSRTCCCWLSMFAFLALAGLGVGLYFGLSSEDDDTPLLGTLGVHYFDYQNGMADKMSSVFKEAEKDFCHDMEHLLKSTVGKDGLKKCEVNSFSWYDMTVDYKLTLSTPKGFSEKDYMRIVKEQIYCGLLDDKHYSLMVGAADKDKIEFKEHEDDEDKGWGGMENGGMHNGGMKNGGMGGMDNGGMGMGGMHNGGMDNGGMDMGDMEHPKPHICYGPDSCAMDMGMYICQCPKGSKLDQKTRMCHDINECEMDNGMCEEYCINTDGGYFCSCPPKQKLARDGHSCEDAFHPCEPNPCMNGGACLLAGDSGYYCMCKPGSAGDVCQLDENECMKHNGFCDGVCTNTEGGYNCSCPPGKTLSENMVSCHAIEDCEADPCHHGVCVDRDDGYDCHCDAGFTGAMCHIEVCDMEGGWVHSPHGDSCYRVYVPADDFMSNVTQIEAEAECRAENASLVSINDDSEMAFLDMLMSDVFMGGDQGSIWTGLMIPSSADFTNETTYMFTDNSENDGVYINFTAESKFLNAVSSFTGEICVAIRRRYWNSATKRRDFMQPYPCDSTPSNHVFNYICEKPSA